VNIERKSLSTFADCTILNIYCYFRVIQARWCRCSSNSEQLDLVSVWSPDNSSPDKSWRATILSLPTPSVLEAAFKQVDHLQSRCMSDVWRDSRVRGCTGWQAVHRRGSYSNFCVLGLNWAARPGKKLNEPAVRQMPRFNYFIVTFVNFLVCFWIMEFQA